VKISGGIAPPSIEWAVVAPEFPPAPGGVSDYTALVAKGLASEGDAVRVFFPGSGELANRSGSPRLVPLERGLGLAGLALVLKQLVELPRDARVLLQYAPHAFGYKGLNFPFVKLLSSFTRNPLDVMFHEVAYPSSPENSIGRRVLSAVQFEMAHSIAKRADRVFVSADAWRPLIECSVRKSTSISWLPVPSNLPVVVPPEDRAAARRMLGEHRNMVLGHFGTFAPGLVGFLSASLPSLLTADSGRACVLMGRGAGAFRDILISGAPSIGDQLVALEGCSAQELARVISACDIMLQPYPDGVSGRRSTIMAALALGVPAVTTSGRLSESLWETSGGVVLSPADSYKKFAPAVEELLRDPIARVRLGQAGKKLYQSTFDVSHTVRRLRQI